MQIARQKRTFQDVCRSRNGAFPADVLRQLTDTREIDFSDLPDDRSILDGVLPEPHPIDFEWRFDDQSAKLIADLAHRDENILCLGTPTVFFFIAHTNATATLVDRNPLVIEPLKNICRSEVICGDATTFRAKRGTFSTVIMDPPWYPSDIDGWITNALPLLSKNASLYIPLFRADTRPTAAKERAELVTKLSKIGDVQKLLPNVRYRTPVFEAEVLSRLSLPKLPLWRMADLYRVSIDSAERWHTPSRREPSPPTWERLRFGDQVVAIKSSSQDKGPVRYNRNREHQNSFEVCTVSRRDATRNSYTVWTSRNRAAAVMGTSRLSGIFRCSHPHRQNYCDDDVRVAIQLARDLKFPIEAVCDEPNNHITIS